MGAVEVSSKNVLLTGASSGIGRALARKLASRGARLAMAARSEDLLVALADELAPSGARPSVLVTDLSVRGNAAELAARARQALGSIDILVNNAGVGAGGAQTAVADTEVAREVFETNYWSPLALQKALVPDMVRQGGGAVVNVTSLAQVMTWPALGHYSSTKAALAIATETLRLELGHSGVHVLEVIPGPVRTAIQAESRLLPGFARAMANAPQGNPEELAALIVRALERGRSRLVYPRRLWITYVLPGLLRAALPKVSRRLVSPAEAGEALAEGRVVRAGSRGDAEVLQVRREWEEALQKHG